VPGRRRARAASFLRRLAAAANDNRWVSAVVRALPDRVFRRLAGAVGGRLPELIDLEPATLIAERDPVWLADAGNLERELLPRLGLSDDVPHVYPAALQHAVGHGLRHWQYPCQFAPYLVELSRRSVRSYLEIGVRHGGTFVITVEYLSRFGAVDRAVAVDLDHVPALDAYAEQHPEVRTVQVDSRSKRFVRVVRDLGPFDLVLVDGNHAYEAVRSDIETVLPHTSMLALHDIVDDASPGVRRAWAELRATQGHEFELLEFTAQYDEVLAVIGRPVLGIGLAIRRPTAL
jgi:hypothetical protein